MSLDPLKERIQLSISNIAARLEVLKRGRDQYEEIKKALENEQLLRKDEKGVPRVTIRVGDGWFIDYTVSDAKQFLEKQLVGAEDELSQLESKLESANKALKDLAKVELDENDLDKEMRKNDVSKHHKDERNGKSAIGEEVNDGELPVMDIREELDEEGNVISSSVEPQKKESDWEGIAEKHLNRAAGQKEEQPETYGPELPPGFIRKTTLDMPKKPTVSSNSSVVPKNLHPRIEDVTEAVGEINISSSSPNAAGSSRVNIPTSDPAGSEPVSQPELEEEYDVVKSTGASSIATEELLELELIANEFDEDEDDFVDEDYQFIENTDDEEEYEDEYGRTRGSMFPFLSKEMLEKQKGWSQLLRNKEVSQEDPSPSSESAKTKADRKVRFAEEVEIKRFDKHNASNDQVPAEEPEPETTAVELPKAKRVSRFKADRMANKQDRNLVPPVSGDLPVRETITEAASVAESIFDRPVSDILEQPTGTKPVSDIVDKSPVSNVLERISQGPVQEIKERALDEIIIERPPLENQPVSDIMERPAVSGLFERPTSDTIIESAPKPINNVIESDVSYGSGVNPVGDIVEKSSASIVDNDIRERHGPVGDIIEKEAAVGPIKGIQERHAPVGDIVERESVAVGVVSDIMERRGLTGDIFEKPGFDTFVEKHSEPSANPVKSRRGIKPVAVHRKGSKIPPALARANKYIKPAPIVKHKYDPGRVVDIPPEKVSDPTEDFKKPHGVSQEVYDRAKEYFKEAILTPEQFLEAFDDGSEPSEMDRKKKIAPPTILSSDIVERPNIQPLDEEDEDYSHDMALMAKEYQRIRERLINRSGGFRETDDEKALEPVDEDGNPIKHSRFKSAQLFKRTGL